MRLQQVMEIEFNIDFTLSNLVFGVIQIGLRGGIFQYTNAMKSLGKPSPTLEFEDAYVSVIYLNYLMLMLRFFCYPEYELVHTDQCRRRGNRRNRRRVVKRDDFVR